MRFIFFHGNGGTRDSFWLPWLREELEKSGHEVISPNLPNTAAPTLEEWLKAALTYPMDDNTVLVGHSSGAVLILSVLEQIKQPIKKAILVAGYARQPGSEKPPFLQDVYHWEKIAHNAQDFIFINSDNDPWGCTDVEGRYILDALGKGTLVVPKGQGHMGSGRFNQPYLQFPLLKALCLVT